MVSNRRARMALHMSHWQSNTRYVTYYTGTILKFRPVQLKKSRSRSRADNRFMNYALAFFQQPNTVKKVANL